MTVIKNHDCADGLSYVAIESRMEHETGGIDWVGIACLLMDTAFISFGLVMAGAAFTAYLLR